MNAEISETIRATILGLGMQIPEIPAQRKIVSEECHAYSDAHKPPKTVAPTVLMLEYKFQQKCNTCDNEAKGYVITPFPNMIGYVPLR